MRETANKTFNKFQQDNMKNPSKQVDGQTGKFETYNTGNLKQQTELKTNVFLEKKKNVIITFCLYLYLDNLKQIANEFFQYS